MKKVLLGTTALVAASALAVSEAKAEIEIKANGYQSLGFALDDGDQDLNNGAVSYQNFGLQFVGSKDLDNGLKIGMTIDFAADTGAGDIDEARFSVTGDFGQISVGGDDEAADLFHKGAGGVATNALQDGTWGAYFEKDTGLNAGSGLASFATGNSFGSDDAGVWYFTPNMGGFRAGVSYQPEAAVPADSSPADSSNDSTVLSNVISFGAEHKLSMDGLSIDMSVGVSHVASVSDVAAKKKPGTFTILANAIDGESENKKVQSGEEDTMVETPMSATGPKVGGDDSRTHYRASAGMSAGGFTAKVSYAAADYVVAAFTDTQGNADPTDDVHHIAQHDAWTFASMLSYSAGAHTVGVEYVYSELDGGNLGDNKGAHETRGFLVGYSNAISGGLVWDARIAFIDADRLGKDKSRDITAFETGLGFSF